MERSRKRRRTVPVVFQTSQKRPIDKNLVNILIAAQGATQTNISLITATFPATITGIRWSLRFFCPAAGGANYGGWAIVRVKDGLAPNTMSFTNAATFLEPEQEVIAFGRWAVTDVDNGAGPAIDTFEGTTKSMRKLMGGDQIYFVCNGLSVAGTIVEGTIQFFSKT